MSENINNEKVSGLALPALGLAVQQLGQKETPMGSNSGPMVDKYLLSVGLSPGYAWCQAFVYWCYASVAAKQNVRCPVIRTAGVKECWNKVAKSQKIMAADARRNPGMIAPGDQFILLFGNGSGHTGLVERTENDVIFTIEGNSNEDGSREGYEVVRHTRKLADKALLGFIKYN